MLITRRYLHNVERRNYAHQPRRSSGRHFEASRGTTAVRYVVWVFDAETDRDNATSRRRSEVDGTSRRKHPDRAKTTSPWREVAPTHCAAVEVVVSSRQAHVSVGFYFLRACVRANGWAGVREDRSALLNRHSPKISLCTPALPLLPHSFTHWYPYAL